MKIVNIAILIGNSLALSKNLSTFKKKTIDFFSGRVLHSPIKLAQVKVEF